MMPRADPLHALRHAVADLLRASSREDLGAVVDGAELQVGASSETWHLGSRAVAAQRIALLVEPEVFVRLQSREADLAVIREAVASVVRSFETELAELCLFVKIPTFPATGWGEAYRSAPPPVAEVPSPDRVRTAAAAVARAFGHEEAASILDRAHLSSALVEASSALHRWLVRLSSEDFVAVDRASHLRSQVEAAVRAAAASPAGHVGEVRFGA